MHTPLLYRSSPLTPFFHPSRAVIGGLDRSVLVGGLDGIMICYTLLVLQLTLSCVELFRVYPLHTPLLYRRFILSAPSHARGL